MTFNSAWLLLSRISNHVLLLLLTVFVARQLGERGLGQFAFINAIMLVGNVLTTFGLDTLLIREVAGRARAETPLVASALVLQLAISALFILLIAFAGVWMPEKLEAETLPALRLASLSLIPLAVSSVYSAVLRAFERMKLYLLFSLISSGAQLAIGLLMVNLGWGLMGLAWAMLLGHATGAVGAMLLCWARLPDSHHSWQVNWVVLRRTAAASWRLALLMVMAVLYQKLAVLALSLLADEAATGLFSAAARIVEAAKLIPYAVFGALFPSMARRAVRGSRREAGKIRNESEWGLLLLYAIGCGLGLSWLADNLISWLYGSAYGPSVGALRLLAWSLVPFVVSLRCSFELISRGQDGLALRATWLATMTTFLLCVLLVPAWGLSGACWAVLIGELIQAVILLVNLQFDRWQATPAWGLMFVRSERQAEK